MSLDVLGRVEQVLDGVLTRLVKHLVTLVENKVLQVGEAEMPVTDERIDTSRCTNDDVRVRILVAEELDVLLNGCSTVEDTDLYVRQELGETVVLVPDLVGELTGVAHNQNRSDTGLRLLVHLLEGSEDEDGCLSETRLGLAENVVAEDGLGNCNLLDCRARSMSERILKRSQRSV
jgi:hypothetical protein